MDTAFEVVWNPDVGLLQQVIDVLMRLKFDNVTRFGLIKPVALVELCPLRG